MLQIRTVRKAVYDKLKSKFGLPVYFDEVVDGMNKPCFYVEIDDSGEGDSPGIFFRHLVVTVTYYQEEANEVDKMQKQSDLIGLFLPVFVAGDRNLTTATVQSEIYGNFTDVMEFNFTTDFYDDLEIGEETASLMENFEFETRKEDEI